MDQCGRGKECEMTLACDNGKEPKFTFLDYFLACFPKTQIEEMVSCTNTVLEDIDLDHAFSLTVGELLKFFGVLILITRFEFGSRASLWSDMPLSKCVLVAALGCTGVSHQHFDLLFTQLVWSPQVK